MPRKLLVVEDEPDVLESFMDLVGQVPGYEAHRAINAREARELLEAGHWAVIVADELLPDGSGLELLSEAAHTQPQAARALMSAYPVFRQLIEGLNLHLVEKFFAKPFDPPSIEGWLTEVSDRRARASGDFERIPPLHRDVWIRGGW